MHSNGPVPSSSLVRVGAVGWMVSICMVFAMFGFMAFGAITNLQSPAVFKIFGGILGLLFVGGCPFLAAVILCRCPRCGKQFFRNSDGLGTRTFRYHPDCPRLPGVNPLVYQTVRCASTGHMRCIHCGQEVFPTEPAKA